MSHERNHKAYVHRYHKGVDKEGKIDLAAIATSIGMPPGEETQKKITAIGETRTRAYISKKLGANEEKYHDTSIDDETKKRIRPVPEAVAKHHNQLVDSLYAFLAPKEADITADTPDAESGFGDE